MRTERNLKTLPLLAEWTVPPDEIDHIDHMGTAFYSYRAEKIGLTLVSQLGAEAKSHFDEAPRLVVVDRHTRYRREQRLGARLLMYGGVTSAVGSRFGVYLEIMTAETDDLAASFNLVIELRDRRRQQPVDISPSWREAAAENLVEASPHGKPRTLTSAKIDLSRSPRSFEDRNISPYLSQIVRADLCDSEGFLELRKPIFDPETHIPKIGIMSPIWDFLPGYFWPMIEQRDVREKIARSGDILDHYEAVLGVESKSIHYAVWVYERKSRALVESRNLVMVLFNSKTRKSESIPPALREELSKIRRY